MMMKLATNHPHSHQLKNTHPHLHQVQMKYGHLVLNWEFLDRMQDAVK